MKNEVYTASANANIAFVKYWGKKSDNIPFNSSVSMTLGNNVSTITSVVFSDKLQHDQLFINGVPVDASKGGEKAGLLFDVLSQMRKLAGVKEHALIVSKNSFPASTGLASSASGAAAFAYAVNSALGLGLSSRSLSIIARKISGSGCRSVFGGFVLWHAGNRSEESYAEQIKNENHWPQLIDAIAIVTEAKKKVSSSEGHIQTIKTSKLYKHRIPFAEENASRAVELIHNKDLHNLSELIMRDSNNMHATMLDSWPPIHYITDSSWRIIDTIHEINDAEGKNIAAYTLDAGPNVHIITEKRYSKKVLNEVGNAVGDIKFIISHAGGSPRLLPDNMALIDEKLNIIK